MDVAAILLVVVFFTPSLALTHMCDRLATLDDPHARGNAEEFAMGGV